MANPFEPTEERPMRDEWLPPFEPWNVAQTINEGQLDLGLNGE